MSEHFQLGREQQRVIILCKPDWTWGQWKAAMDQLTLERQALLARVAEMDGRIAAIAAKLTFPMADKP